MRIKSLIISIFSLVFIMACQPQVDSYVRFDIEDGSYLFTGQAYRIGLESSDDVVSITLDINGEEQELIGSVFVFTPQDESKDNLFELHGFNNKGDKIVSKKYLFHFMVEPEVAVTSPEDQAQIDIDGEFFFQGAYAAGVDHLVVMDGEEEIATIAGTPFEYRYDFADVGEHELSFLFEDQNGLVIKKVVRKVTLFSTVDPTPVPTPGDDLGDDNQDYNIPLFNRTWENEHSAIVIDAYQGNSIDWDKMAQDQRMVGVIHRSSDGTRTDTKYLERRSIAKNRGYLWGAYHLGRPGNVKAQADLFLDLVDNDPETLMILDLEATSSSSMMDINEAIQFMEYVYDKTGRIPVIYANHTVTLELTSKVKNHPLFQRAPLWYARFRKDIPNFPTGLWNEYFLWQFSSEINCSSTGSCLYNVPGTRYDMDINVFAGTPSQLRREWGNPQ